MNIRRLVSILLVVGIAASILVSVALSKRRESQRQKVTSIPAAYSKIRSLEIVSVKPTKEGTPAAGVLVEIKNNSEKEVMAVDLVCGEGAITKNGLTDEENPITVIKPYGTVTIEMTFSEMTLGAPLVVSAVTYADGTEEGEEESLRIMHRIRDRDRARLKAEKAARKGERP